MSLTSTADIVQATGIGASVMPAICGISPFENQTRWTAFARILGLLGPAEQTEEMEWGLILEPVIVEAFGRKMNLPVARNNLRIYNKTRPWQYATPDALILTVPQQVLECKTVGPRHAGDWDRSTDDEDGVPDYYQVQVQWQLSALDLQTAYVAALFAGQHYRVYRIERDPTLEEILLEEGHEFWRKYILPQVAPPIDGSEHARQYLQKRFPREREKVRRATADETEWLRQYAQLRDALAFGEERKAELENQIIQAIGDAEGLAWVGGKFTWKRTRDRSQTNWEALARAQLVGYADDERKALIQEHTEVVHGYRRVHFRRATEAA